jgi:hypothetical protein
MNISEVMLKAADAIEQNPARFDFATVRVVRSDADPRCVLGEMWWQAGIVYNGHVNFALHHVLHIKEGEFFDALGLAYGAPLDMNDVTKVVPALRKLARRYEGIPEDVRAIFDARPQECVQLE